MMRPRTSTGMPATGPASSRSNSPATSGTGVNRDVGYRTVCFTTHKPPASIKPIPTAVSDPVKAAPASMAASTTHGATAMNNSRM